MEEIKILKIEFEGQIRNKTGEIKKPAELIVTWSNNRHHAVSIASTGTKNDLVHALGNLISLIVNDPVMINENEKNYIPIEEKRDTKFYIDNYQSKTCVCTGFKDNRISFCQECFFLLPEELREGLQGPLNDEEYQWTWNKCFDHLKEIGRISKLRW